MEKFNKLFEQLMAEAHNDEVLKKMGLIAAHMSGPGTYYEYLTDDIEEALHLDFELYDDDRFFFKDVAAGVIEDVARGENRVPDELRPRVFYGPDGVSGTISVEEQKKLASAAANSVKQTLLDHWTFYEEPVEIDDDTYKWIYDIALWHISTS